MKRESKFVHLLSAGGSLLGKSQGTRRLRLPGRKKSAPTVTLPPLERADSGAEPRRAAKRIHDLTGLNFMIEKIIRQSRGERKTKET